MLDYFCLSYNIKEEAAKFTIIFASTIIESSSI